MFNGTVESEWHELSENIWFVRSKTSYSVYIVEMSPMRDEQQPAREDRAFQLVVCETLSLAIISSAMADILARI